MNGVQFPTCQGFYFQHNIQTGTGAHTVHCPVGTRFVSWGLKQ
jgi:hypothetical protein